MKHKIFIAILASLLMVCPMFVACNKQDNNNNNNNPDNYNQEAESGINDLFNYEFFPFELVSVTSVTYDATETDRIKSFEFACDDIEEVKLSMKTALQELGFSQEATSEVLTLSKTEDLIKTVFHIVENEGAYIFSFSVETLEPAREDINEKIFELLGFSFDFPDTVEFTSSEVQNGVAFKFATMTKEELCAIVEAKFEEEGQMWFGDFGMVTVEGDKTYTVWLKDDPEDGSPILEINES